MRITSFSDPFNGKEGVYMITLDHLERQLLFRSDKDYVFGVNTLAIGTLKFKVFLLCYVLMDNHLHILVRGRYSECLSYYRWIVHRLTLMLSREYGVRGLLKQDAADVQAVLDPQALLNEVAYLLRNSYKARIDSPFNYRWTPSEVYFNPYLELMRGESFSGSEAAKILLGTHTDIPPYWEHHQGRILNKCFIDYPFVERVVGTGLALFDRVRKYDLESSLALTHGIEERISFTDSEMQEKILVICRHELHVESPHQLPRKDLLHLARTIAKRFACPPKQISRLLGIDQSVLDTVL